MIKIFTNDLPDDFVLHGDLAIDTEAMGLNISRDRLCLVQLSNGAGNSYLVQFTDNTYHAPNLAKLLTNDSTKIFHFARFDLAIIKHYLKIDITNIFCTKIASQLVRTYSSSHSLKELCKELLGVHLSKQTCQSDWGHARLSLEQQEYAASDVTYLHQLRNILVAMLAREERLAMAQKIFAFLPTRVELDLKGWQDIDIFAHSQVKH